MSLICQIFRSSRKQEMYLYVELARGLEDVPAELMHQFGEPTPVMTLVLTADKSLARANVEEVMSLIERQGYYLQMPPAAIDLAAAHNARG
jgi:uncharacterized protein YcgL (UPF0745 family)